MLVGDFIFEARSRFLTEAMTLSEWTVLVLVLLLAIMETHATYL